MEHGPFHCPLSHQELAELGRATYLWGVADFLAEMLVQTALGIKDRDALRQLIKPLMIGKKITILSKLTARFKNDEARAAVVQFCAAVSKLNEGRNHAIHGYWALKYDPVVKESFVGAYTYKKPDLPLYPAEISRIANDTAKAARMGALAFLKEKGADVDDSIFPTNFWLGPDAPPQFAGAPTL